MSFYDPPETHDKSEGRSGLSWADFIKGILALIAALGLSLLLR